MDVLLACVFVHHTYAWCPAEAQEEVRFSGTGVTDGCDPPCGCWETNPGP